MNTIKCIRTEDEVIAFVDGEELDFQKSLKYVNHSPTGFEFGYYGSGPAQLSFAILSKVVGPDIAKKYYMDFKDEVVAKFKNDIVEKEIDINLWVILMSKDIDKK